MKDKLKIREKRISELMSNVPGNDEIPDPSDVPGGVFHTRNDIEDDLFEAEQDRSIRRLLTKQRK